MRKFTTLVISFLTFSTSIFAQSHKYYDTKHEIGVTIGTLASTQIGSMNDSQLTDISPSAAAIKAAGLESYDTNSYSPYGPTTYLPNISIEYYYHVSKVIGIGGFLAFNGNKRDMHLTYLDKYEVWQSKKTGVARFYNFSLTPSIRFDYLRKKNFGMYGKTGIGVGIMYESQKEDVKEGVDFNDATLVFIPSITLLGMEAGSLKLRVFTEIGFSDQGILLIGGKYRF